MFGIIGDDRGMGRPIILEKPLSRQ